MTLQPKNACHAQLHDWRRKAHYKRVVFVFGQVGTSSRFNAHFYLRLQSQVPESDGGSRGLEKLAKLLEMLHEVRTHMGKERVEREEELLLTDIRSLEAHPEPQSGCRRSAYPPSLTHTLSCDDCLTQRLRL